MEYMVSLFKLFTQHWELKQHTALVEKNNSAGQTDSDVTFICSIFIYLYYILGRYICRLDVTRAFCEATRGYITRLLRLRD